jgi:hypothetical protein
MTHRSFSTRLWALALGLGLLALTAGCSGNKSSKVTVQGKVTYASQPAAGVRITFKGANNDTVSTLTKAGGNYIVTEVPRGEVKVAVETPPSMTLYGNRAPAPPKGTPVIAPAEGEVSKATRLPTKYRDPESSGLRYTVEQSNQEINVDLAK